MGKKYNIIYADPPWQFQAYSANGEGKNAGKHYHTMHADEIRLLPVEKIAADDCVLFLWVTFPCLLEGLSVMQSWGFSYKTCAFCWVKRNKRADSYFFGLGFWTRSNAELCILGTRENRKGCQSPCRRYAMRGLWNTAESRMKSVTGSWSCAGTFRA